MASVAFIYFRPDGAGEIVGRERLEGRLQESRYIQLNRTSFATKVKKGENATTIQKLFWPAKPLVLSMRFQHSASASFSEPSAYWRSVSEKLRHIAKG